MQMIESYSFIQALNCSISLLRCAHRDKPEAPTPASVFVKHNLGALDGAVVGEHGGELVVGDGPGDVPDVELPRRHLLGRLEHRRGGDHPHHHRRLPAPRPPPRGPDGEAGGAPAEAAAVVEGRGRRGYEGGGDGGGGGGRHWWRGR